MKFRRWVFALILLALGILPLAGPGCGSPAGPPVPQGEVPVPISIKLVGPERLIIDYSTVGGEERSFNIAASVIKAVGAGPRSPTIVFGPQQVNDVENDFLIPSLKGIDQIEFPPEVDIYRDTVTFTDETVFLRGTQDVAVDFRPTSIDIDNDGVNETGSGISSEVPAFIMIYINDIRYSIWHVVEAVSEDDATIGEGFFKTFIDDLDGFTTKFATSYQQLESAPDERRFEFFLNAVNNDTRDIIDPQVGEPREFNYHLKTAQIGPDDTAFKDININARLEFLDEGLGLDITLLIQYIGRFVEGQDPWSGSLITQIITNPSSNIEDSTTELDICASILTGTDIDKTECDDVEGFNLRDGNDEFIREAEPGDFVVPAEFSATPQGF
jgi:hypothetical protein